MVRLTMPDGDEETRQPFAPEPEVDITNLDQFLASIGETNAGHKGLEGEELYKMNLKTDISKIQTRVSVLARRDQTDLANQFKERSLGKLAEIYNTEGNKERFFQTTQQIYNDQREKDLDRGRVSGLQTFLADNKDIFGITPAEE